MLILSIVFIAMNTMTASAAENDNALENISNDNATVEGDDNEHEASAVASTPDTWITGQLNWRDRNGTLQPLRFCKIKIKRTDSIIDYVVYEGYTDQNGEYYIEFTNDSSDGIVDLEIEVFAEGTDVKVKDASGHMYSDVIEQKNIFVGEHTISHVIYTMDSTLGQALQILQAVICASMYYEAMKGEDVDDVDIIYPHESSKQTCFYREANILQPVDTIYIVGVVNESSFLKSYESWDVITHEYGHHVANHENLDSYFSGGHGGEDMAEHYLSHFQSNNFDCASNCALDNSPTKFMESECKYQGSSLAWGEGYATFFGELAQQYFFDTYDCAPIYTAADKQYTSYNGFDYSIESEDAFLSNKGENSEIAVQRILYDLYDGVLINDSEDFDKIAFGHQELWDCITSSGKTTLFEFIRYLQNAYLTPSQRSALGELLAAHRLTCVASIIPDMSMNSPVVQFVWKEIDENRYFTARKFQVNFYDENYNLIVSTPVQVVELDDNNLGVITVDDELVWETIIDFPTYFYVSVTVYEFDGDLNNTLTNSYVTYYESAYTMYFSPGHIHNYTYNYIKNNSSNHKSYCVCGAYILENHFFISSGLKSSCRDCGYIATGNVPIIKPTVINSDNDQIEALPPEEERTVTCYTGKRKNEGENA